MNEKYGREVDQSTLSKADLISINVEAVCLFTWEVIKLDAEVKESKKQVGEGVIKSFPNSIVNEINTGALPPRSFGRRLQLHWGSGMKEESSREDKRNRRRS
ncbi:hypothetical protein TNCV_4875951 [Trichonephila clavipes]|nr:hypothetical protein TNCV_4875951 [Trichonephila clavipes]